MANATVFEKTISLLADMPSEYKLSGVAICLFFFVAWTTFNNPRIVATLDRSLNERLQKIQLFRILRILLLLGFIFSALLVSLAFLSPIALRYADAHHLDIAAKALEDMKNGNYSQSRRRYQAALRLKPDEATSEEIKGMITATYYGQGLHKEGLEYICEIYKGRAASDTRYVFAIQAHLRAISKKKDSDESEKLAKAFRTKCGRADFSELWAHVPFAMMESARTGVPRSKHGYSLDAADKDGLRKQLNIKKKESMGGLLPFEDFALYFLSDFSSVLRDFPKSSLRELTLFDAASLGLPDEKIIYYKRYVEEYPETSHTSEAYLELVKLFAAKGQQADALRYTKLAGDASRDAAVEIMSTPVLASIHELAKKGDFKAAHSLADNTCRSFKDQDIKCDEKMNDLRARLSQTLKALAKGETQKSSCNEIFFKIRSQLWIHGARSFLDACIAKASMEGVALNKALYLLASVSRAAGEYDKSRDYLLRLVQTDRKSSLIDDANAELGFHYLLVEKNWPLAQKYLIEVVAVYPDKNAYDNALWWLARGHRDRGEYAQAIKYYSMIVAWKAKGRFNEWSKNEQTAIAKISNLAPFSGITMKMKPGEENLGVFVATVEKTAPSQQLGIEIGDSLVSFCGEEIDTVDAVFSIAGRISDQQSCEVVFRRNQTLLSFKGSGVDFKNWTVKRSKAPAQKDAN